jgi:hypothetical protein
MGPIDAPPDFALSLALDAYAPRAARYHIAQVDRPSPDLRDAVVLLTSELVTRAVQHCQSAEQKMELRAWMPNDVVRVELQAPGDLLHVQPDSDGSDYGLLLLDQLADRWSVDQAERSACMWFEIDRHPRVQSEAAPADTRSKRLASLRWRGGRRQTAGGGIVRRARTAPLS